EFFDLFLHLGHAAHAADQDDVIDFACLDAGILDGDAARLDRALDQLFDQGLELGAGDLQVKVLGTGSIGRDVRQVDLGLLRGRQLDLGLFGRFFQALQSEHVLGQVDAAFLLEFTDDVVNDALVEVFAAQEGVAVGGQYFELLLAVDIGNFNDGYVE